MAASGRGGGWVVLQFAVMGLVVAAGFAPPHWAAEAHDALSLAGAILALGGGATAVWASRRLGPSFTPFPRPLETGELVDSGPYRLVRHPVYSAGLMLFLGYSLYSSLPALAGTGVLAVVWGLKARVEERFLRARYPEYGAYAARVRYRLLPFLY
jgi:protein-S-isoprenylcysteine O-methyltransferase Ste14